jgi:predicted permease
MTLALCGGAAALLCGTWAASGLQRLLFPDARWTASAWDERTLLFTGLITIAAGALAGLAPVLQWTTPDLVTGLTASRAVGSLKSRTTRASLVVVQIALSLALLVGSGLLVMSLIRLDAVNLGFDPEGLVTVSISPVSLNSIRNRQSSPAPEVAARAAASEGVEAVALASVAPFGATRMIDISVPGSPFVPESVRDQPLVNFVSANYFSVMATRVLRGRGFDDRDASGSEPVAVVSDSMARRYWGGTIPEGGCILRYGGPCARVVGTVEDVRDTPGGEAPRMRFYLPLTQVSDLPDAVIVRTDAERASMVAGILRSTAPAGYRATVEVISDRVGRALRPWRTAALLFIAFGAVALVLACIGVYSVMSYIAAERVHELGVRIVLGATARDVLRLVLIDGLRLSVLGGVVGVCGAAVAARYLGSLLFEVSPFEPAIYAIGLLCLTGAGLCAMLPAALRASRVDPVVALRRE